MKYMMLAILMALVVIPIGCGCGGRRNNDNQLMGTVELKVTLPSSLGAVKTRSISEIIEMRVTVSATDMTSPVVRKLTIDPVTHTASDRFLVPAGDNRQFLAEALNSAGAVIYSGTATLKYLAVGATVKVDVVLKAVNASVELVVIIHEGEPGLQFTSVPPIGSYNNLKGIITGGINPGKLSVAVYIKVGSGWWTKPYWNSPLTLPKSDGTWECDITTGGIDSTASEVLAYLVGRTSTPPAASGTSTKPVIADALATVDVIRTQ